MQKDGDVVQRRRRLPVAARYLMALIFAKIASAPISLA